MEASVYSIWPFAPRGSRTLWVPKKKRVSRKWEARLLTVVDPDVSLGGERGDGGGGGRGHVDDGLLPGESRSLRRLLHLQLLAVLSRGDQGEVGPVPEEYARHAAVVVLQPYLFVGGGQ